MQYARPLTRRGSLNQQAACPAEVFPRDGHNIFAKLTLCVFVFHSAGTHVESAVGRHRLPLRFEAAMATLSFRRIMEAQPSNDTADTTPSLSPGTTGLFFVIGKLLPSFGLFLMLNGSPVPASWQSGKLYDYATFLLSSETAALFFPFFFYAIACFTLALFRTETAGGAFWIQLGVYSGIVLGVQYGLVVGIVLFQVDLLLTWNGIFTVFFKIPVAALLTVGIPWLVWRALRVLKRLLQRRGHHAWWLAFLMFGGPCLAIAFGLAPLEDDASDWLYWAVVGPSAVMITATPVWMVAVYTALIRHIHRFHQPRFRFGLLQMLGVSSWLTAYVAAWRFAVVRTLEGYAALPPTPPSACYVATAAAAGHPAIVRSWPIRCTDGSLRRVNLQLAYLKCGELSIQTLAPRWHGYVRFVYDRIGPPAARLLRHPLAADGMYLALKPAEWLTRLMLRCLHPGAAKLATRLYR
jgi:hypothetical protein